MSIDIRLSPEGDLVLGQQAVDKDGYLLYYQFYGENEAVLTNNPEEGTIPVRDMATVSLDEKDLQLIRTRLMTENPDWRLYPKVGADLTDLIGLPNNQTTAQKGKELILRALTYDGAFRPEELQVEGIPVGPTTLLFDVQLKRSSLVLRYLGTMDLRLGVWNEYELKKEGEIR